MKRNIRAILYLVLFTGLVGVNAQTLVIDDFDSYADTSELQANWNSFGGAASAGPPSLASGSGVGGSNAASFSLNWNLGTNGNMRRLNLAGTDLSTYDSIDITAFIETQSGFSGPASPTILKIAIQGSNGAIWQTTVASAQEPNVDSYTTLSFILSDSDMELADGSGSFVSTIASVDNIRLRYENASQDSRQTVLVSSIVAVPEPGTYGLMLGSLILVGVVLIRRKREVA